MKYAYATDSIRAAEAEVMAVVGDDALMQQAANGLAVECARRLRRHRGKVTGSRVLVIVGPGNNGGDGLFAATRLARKGAKIFLWRITDQVHQAGWQAATRAGATEVDLDRSIELMPTLDQVIEAGFGIGGREGISDDLARLVYVSRGIVDVVAVDLPSGLGVETLSSDVRFFDADATVTFGAWKPSLLAGPAREYAGEVTFVDIGLEPDNPILEVWDALDVAMAWPFPTATDDKYARGVVGLDAGSAEYPGAGLLALGGAVHAGAGMVRFLGPVELRDTVIAQFPNVVHGRGRCQALLCGPGWGPGDHLADRLASRLAEGLRTVIDADALAYLPRDLGDNILLTPHAGELARLLKTERAAVENDPLTHVRRAADETGATVLLKGATQYVATPGETCVRVAVGGPAWTGQAGSGDTLAGICAALLAAGLDAATAAVVGASVQAITARSHPGPHTPQELAARLPDTIAELEWLLEETP
ncbi:NAD(P)H-hydrate epimerase [Ammonicoccus fulvus]|uniref:ADP-dependent (S)-NAD(P)H-hydrate dehydratase n=1 Tax=Ammonicoccus fulvus TaxID=3138240 RepID=A0ABZ3FVP6_9ACTN